MDQRLTPEFFYGSAVAALVGLLFGLMLHAAWQNNPGGPRIMPNARAVAEAVSPGTDHPPATPAAPIELADQEAGPVAPDPLPVTRLSPQMFEAQPAAEDEQRERTDDTAADAAPQAPPRDLD